MRMTVCENDRMWEWPYVRMTVCENDRMWEWPYVRMTVCENDHMWEWPYVRMTVCENDHMWMWFKFNAFLNCIQIKFKILGLFKNAISLSFSWIEYGIFWKHYDFRSAATRRRSRTSRLRPVMKRPWRECYRRWSISGSLHHSVLWHTPAPVWW